MNLASVFMNSLYALETLNSRTGDDLSFFVALHVDGRPTLFGRRHNACRFIMTSDVT